MKNKNKKGIKKKREEIEKKKERGEKMSLSLSERVVCVVCGKRGYTHSLHKEMLVGICLKKQPQDKRLRNYRVCPDCMKKYGFYLHKGGLDGYFIEDIKKPIQQISIKKTA